MRASAEINRTGSIMTVKLQLPSAQIRRSGRTSIKIRSDNPVTGFVRNGESIKTVTILLASSQIYRFGRGSINSGNDIGWFRLGGALPRGGEGNYPVPFF